MFKTSRVYPTKQISSKSKYISPKRASSVLKFSKSKTTAKQKQNLTLKNSDKIYITDANSQN